MRTPTFFLLLAVLAGCVVVDDTRPAATGAGGVTGPADPTAYLKPIAKPTPATKDPGLVPTGAPDRDAPAGDPNALPSAAAVEPDPDAPTGDEPIDDAEAEEE